MVQHWVQAKWKGPFKIGLEGQGDQICKTFVTVNFCHCWSFEDGGVCSQVKAKLGEELSFVLRLPLLIALPAKEEEEEALLTYFWSWEEGGRGKRTGGQIRQHRPRLLRGGKLRARRSSWSCQAVDFRAKSSEAFFFSLKRDSCRSLYIEVTLPAFSFTVQNFS